MMDRKMRILLISTGLYLCALFSLSGLRRSEPAPTPAVSAPAVSVPSSALSSELFIVGEFDGLLAVYCSGIEQPNEVYPDIRIAELPQEDRLLLGRGIPAASSAQLQRILEDYLN